MTHEEGARALLDRFEWLFKVRPMPVAELLMRLLTPSDRRSIIETLPGVRMFADPLSNLGRALVRNREYEPEIAAIFEAELKSGQTVVDIGANEGFFSCLAGLRVGEKGRVVAVEPQSRLQAVLEVNVGLNALHNVTRVQAAVGETAGEERLHLAPLLNHGASSLARRARFWIHHEDVKVITAQEIFDREQIAEADFVKVDVEGYEDHVVRSLLPLCQAGRVRTLLLDYHAPILEQRGVSATSLHASLLDHGMRADGTPELRSYVVYRRAA